MKEIEFRGKKYNLNDENCYKCNADCGLNYCFNVCYDKFERLPIDIEWQCCECKLYNTHTDVQLENEYVECGCKIEYSIDVENGKVISIEELHES